MKNNNESLIKDIQAVVYQMKLDDIEDNPESEFETFECSACAKTTSLAGSIQYSKYRLCNDCVLIAETGLALGKFKNVQELIDATEDKRLEEICEYIKTQEGRKPDGLN